MFEVSISLFSNYHFLLSICIIFPLAKLIRDTFIISKTTFHVSKINLRFTPALRRKLYIWRMWNQAVLARLSAYRILVRTAVIVPIAGAISTANANVLTSVTPVSTT